MTTTPQPAPASTDRPGNAPNSAKRALDEPRSGQSGAIVAYLVNQYPTVSHTFIRREIQALESLGQPVMRISIRRFVGGDLHDPADRAEAERTRVILGEGLLALLIAEVVTMLSRPRAWWRGLVTAVRAGWKSDRGVLRHFVYHAEACLAVRWMRDAGVRHVHAHFGSNPAMVAWIGYALGGPTFSFTIHGADEVDRVHQLSLVDKTIAARFVAAVSHYGRSQLCRWLPHRYWPKVRVVRCGLDAMFLDSEPTPVPDAPRFVSVGRLCREKAPLLLVDAARELRDRGYAFEMVLVGDGPLRAELEQRIDVWDLQDHVRITGYLANDDVRRELIASRALVLPSFIEGLPVVIMEAFAAARPVISTYVAGIPELVVPGVNGWLVPAGSTDALVEAMVEALDADAEQLRQFGLDGRQRVAMQHDALVAAKQLQSAFAADRVLE